jgi:DNA-binding LytR/AlgR family response regulator
MLRCLIVEDEPLAAEVLSDYIREAPGLALAGHCTDALYAMSFLQKQAVDVLFLDLHLPKLKGFDFLRTLPNPPQVIITTAHHEYALEGYELNVVDYLLKPIEFGRFLKAIQKLGLSPATAPPEPEPPTSFFFNEGKKRIKVEAADILYVESLKEYVRIVLPHRVVVTKMQIGELEARLGPEAFMRIHRSFLVARRKIDAYSATEVEIGGKQLPIGRSYQQHVLDRLGYGSPSQDL